MLALFAFAVRWSSEHPDRAMARPLIILASLPSVVADTVGDLVLDRFRHARVPDEFGAKANYRPLGNHTRHDIGGVVMRPGDSTDRPQLGWRLLYGIFAIDGAPRNAVLAISPAFAVEHVWLIPPEPMGGLRIGQAPYPHGFALLSDGSVVAAFDDEQRTLRIGFCGERIWGSDTDLHHALYPVENERFAWGVGSPEELHKLDLRTGKLVQRITIDAIRAANPDISALDIRRIDEHHLGENLRGDTARMVPDPYHLNDAEPLPPELAPYFPMFAPGDLLVSMRNLNLVFALDPRTRRIKWLTNDNLLRQHDPDWNPSGEISVLDNQIGGQFSRIVSFAPATGAHRTVVNGKALDFYTRIRGKHQSLPQGGMLITSSEQGRILELGRDGRTSAELLVHDPDHPGRNFVVSEARFLPADTPAFGKDHKCPAK